MPLWEDIRQSPSFETDYAISSAEVLALPGKSPPSSPPPTRHGNGESPTHSFLGSRNSRDFPSTIISPPSSPAPNYPPPPIPFRARRPSAADVLTELDPPLDPSSSSSSSNNRSRSQSPSTVPLDDIPVVTTTSPPISNPPSPSVTHINNLGVTGISHSTSSGSLSEDAHSSEDAHTPMLTRVLKKRASRGHQRSGSDMNMKKISLNQLVESLTPVSTLPGIDSYILLWLCLFTHVF